VTFGGALRSELTKIRSVRSTYWTLLVMIVATVGLGAVSSYTTTRSYQGPFFDPASWSLGGVWLTQLLIGVVGTLVITSEYSTGMIRTSLTALPQRGLLVTAKVAVFAADLDGRPPAALDLAIADRHRRADVRPVDRIRGVLRVCGHRARRRADLVLQAGRVNAAAGWPDDRSASGGGSEHSRTRSATGHRSAVVTAQDDLRPSADRPGRQCTHAVMPSSGAPDGVWPGGCSRGNATGLGLILVATS